MLFGVVGDGGVRAGNVLEFDVKEVLLISVVIDIDIVFLGSTSADVCLLAMGKICLLTALTKCC